MNQIKSAILLAGGSGTRLLPATSVMSKHLFPVNDKLVIDYSLNTLKNIGIDNLTIVLGGNHFSQIVEYIHCGHNAHTWKHLNINYVYQEKPNGIAAAIQLCKPFIKDNRFAVLLGDNCFQQAPKYNPHSLKSEIFIYNNNNIDLKKFGVLSLDWENDIAAIKEKPQELDAHLNHYAITGFYIFTQKYFDYFQNIQQSARAEFEIVDIINQYLKDGQIDFKKIEGWWSDLGTFDTIEKAKDLMKTTPVEF